MQQDNPNVYRNPKRINAPLTIIVFPAIQFMPAISILSIGMIFNYSMEALGIAVIYFIVVGYILENSSITEVVHRFWRLGLLDNGFPRSRTVVNPLIRKYHS